MSKRREARRNRKEEGLLSLVADEHLPTKPVTRKSVEPIRPMTEGQDRYIKAIKRSQLVYGTGPAGTGKSFIAVSMAAEALDARKIEKLIITRPVIEVGQSIGFLPGEFNEKIDPHFKPVRDILDRRLGQSFTDYLRKNGRIEFAPLGFMRGSTFENAWVILDEAQNVTPSEMKMFLTRIGEGTKVIINGDTRQKDIKGQSGLVDSLRRVSTIDGVEIVRFGPDDIVRSGLVREIIRAYETEGEDELESETFEPPAFLLHGKTA